MAISITAMDTAQDLAWVIVDRHLTISVNILLPAPSMSGLAISVKKVVHMFISSCLEWLLQLSPIWHVGHPLQHLLAIQNAAAHLVTGTERCDHITLVLQQLHWLPVQQLVEFKLAVLVYMVLSICHEIASLLPPPGTVSCNHQTIWRVLCKNQMSRVISFFRPQPKCVLRYVYFWYMPAFWKTRSSNNLLCFIAVLWHFVGRNTSLVRLIC